jgi:hypothetical protein
VGDRLIQSRYVPISGDYRGTFGGEAGGHGQAHTRAGAGDHGDFALQPKRAGLRHFCSLEYLLGRHDGCTFL